MINIATRRTVKKKTTVQKKAKLSVNASAAESKGSRVKTNICI